MFLFLCTTTETPFCADPTHLGDAEYAMVLGTRVCDLLAVLFSRVGRSVLAFAGTSILYLDRGAKRLSMLAIGQVPLHLPFPVVDNHF